MLSNFAALSMMHLECHGCARMHAGLTGLLAAANVPLLVRLSLAHRSDDFVPGVRASSATPSAALTCSDVASTQQALRRNRCVSCQHIRVLRAAQQQRSTAATSRRA